MIKLENHTSNIVEEIVDRYGQGCSCAQAVFAGLSPRLGLPVEQALRIAAPFGGGMARQGQTCGAVSGALMALGLRFGHTCPPADPAAKERTLRLTQEFIGRFRAALGDITCPGLLGFDLSDPVLRSAADEQGTFKQICPNAVRAAVEIWLAIEEQEHAA